MKKIGFIFLLFLGMIGGKAQTKDAVLLLDSRVRLGNLSNGLTYYILPNQESPGVASFYFIGNIGALLETDKQCGLAHFLEHMAFNGIQHFSGQGMGSFLERHGVVAGQDLNAHTGQDETVYKLSNVPVVSSGVVDSCLLVLYDWACGITFGKQKIEQERLVILEEMRNRKDVNFRLMKKVLTVMARGSGYAERDVIGDLAVIRKADALMLQQFYQTWYRPDLLAIVVVGDIDPEEMQQKIRERFSNIDFPEKREKRPVFTIPAHKEDYFVLATDRGVKKSTVSIRIIHEAEKPGRKGWEYLREKLMRMLYNEMFRNRVAFFNQGKNTLIYGANSQIRSFVRGYDLYQIDVMSAASEEAAALELIYRENERVRRFGFTESELERAKVLLLENVETVYRNRFRIKNDELARRLQQHYLEGEPLPEMEAYYQYVKETIPEITVNEFLEYVRKWIVKNNRTIVVTGATEQIHISKGKALAVMEKVEKMELEPWKIKPVEEVKLLREKPQGGKITEIRTNTHLQTEEWMLSNGAKVIFVPDSTAGNVVLMAYSKGGTSVCAPTRLPAAEVLNEFVKVYGVGELDAVTLMQYTKDHQVNCDVNLRPLSETVSGTAPVKRAEELFQLMYMRFEKPRFDLAMHNMLLERRKAESIQQSVLQMIRDSLQMIMNNYHPRVMLRNQEFWEQVSIDSVALTYVERFVDASDFVFFITGRAERERMKILAETYIGSLRTFGRHEVARDNGVRPPKGKTVREIEVDFDSPKAMNWLVWTKEMPYSREHDTYLKVVQFLLRQRCQEMVREKAGGSYDVKIGLTAQREPYEGSKVAVNFECAPARSGELKRLIYDEIRALCCREISMNELEKVTHILAHTYEKEVQQLGYFESVIAWYIDGKDVKDVDGIRNILKEITPQRLQIFVHRLFESADLVDLTFKSRKG